jgi:DNA-binding NarL/FixJ family response regulator
MAVYEVCIAFGDGKPIKRDIEAETGLQAVTAAFNQFPGSRAVHLLKSKGSPDTQACSSGEQASLYAPSTLVGCSIREQLLSKAVNLRSKGWSYSAIAKQLGMGKTTVRTWLTKANIY